MAAIFRDDSGETAPAAAANFIRALALFDLAPSNRLLRRTAGKLCWERGHDERAMQSSIREMLAPLKAALERHKTRNPDQVAQALWALS